MKRIVTDKIEQKDGKAEKTAKKRGCCYCFLDTFSFQAPQFYKERGYKKAYVLEEHPLSQKRYYLTKIL